jgi:RHS repeat-associated protein
MDIIITTAHLNMKYKKYYLGNYEYVDSVYYNSKKEISYIGGFAAQVKWERLLYDPINTSYYLLKDNLGSITRLLDEYAGDVPSAQFNYDSWGRLRDVNGQFYNGFITQGKFKAFDILSNRGYTGHEHLLGMGYFISLDPNEIKPPLEIINMNGRIYDPILGQFMQADNNIQTPEEFIGYDRYAYCRNNPLKYTDPSGEYLHLIIGAIIGGGMNLFMNQDNIHDFWDGLGYFTVGAIGGALGAGMAGGVSSVLAGGKFGAGFVGSELAKVAASCFVSGFDVAGAAGFSNGFVTGFGNSLLMKNKFRDAFVKGLYDGAVQGISGGLWAGDKAGKIAVEDGRKYMSGARITEYNIVQDINGIKNIKAELDYDCLPALGEAGSGIEQEKFRLDLGGDGTKDEILDTQFWKYYCNATNTTARADKGLVINDVKKHLFSGGSVGITSESGIDPISGNLNHHGRWITKVFDRRSELINGTIKVETFIEFMNPTWGCREIMNINSIDPVTTSFFIFKK